MGTTDGSAGSGQLSFSAIDGVEDLARKCGEKRGLKCFVSHVARDDGIVLGDPLDHEVLDRFADPDLELVERIR